MAAILACLTRLNSVLNHMSAHNRILRVDQKLLPVAVLLWTAMVLRPGAVFGGARPPNQEEIDGFFTDATMAFSMCDFEWDLKHYLPTFTHSLSVRGEKPVVVGFEEGYEYYKKICRPTKLPPLLPRKVNRSMTQGSSQTTVQWRVSYQHSTGEQLGGPLEQYLHSGLQHYLGVQVEDIQDVEGTAVLVCDEDEFIKLARRETIVSLHKKDGQTERVSEW